MHAFFKGGGEFSDKGRIRREFSQGQKKTKEVFAGRIFHGKGSFFKGGGIFLVKFSRTELPREFSVERELDFLSL